MVWRLEKDEDRDGCKGKGEDQKVEDELPGINTPVQAPWGPDNKLYAATVVAHSTDGRIHVQYFDGVMGIVSRKAIKAAEVVDDGHESVQEGGGMTNVIST